MFKFTKYSKLFKYVFHLAMLLSALLIFLCLNGIGSYREENTNAVTIFVNGSSCGSVKDASEVRGMVIEARKRLASESTSLVLADCNLVLSGSRDVLGEISDRETVVNNIYNCLKDNVMKTKQPAYEVKINEFTVNLKDIEDVVALLNAAKAEYDEENEWRVSIITDTSRELDVYTTKIERVADEIKPQIDKPVVFPKAGAFLEMEQIYNAAYNADYSKELEFGVKSIGFDEEIEVVQAYVDADKISSLDEAIEAVTKKSERDRIYEVVAGDSVGVVAQKNDMTVADIIALNPASISSAESMLHVGDEIKISSRQPELSVVRCERKYYEENYDAPVQYIENANWYTNESQVVQQPVTGFRKVVADVNYRNSELVSTDVIYEDVIIEAVPKIIEKGTKIPPTYIYPVSGRISSNFGKRKAPKKGASTYHKGLDFAVPVGTAVRASSGGTVIRAGWGSGYGYCVYLQHPDGKVTRYGHLSKVLVKAGQSVGQGDKIALSGNTGVSTGPHLHFEILVGGAQVNPLNYIH